MPAASAPLFGFNDLTIAYKLAWPADDARVTQAAGANTSRITIDWRWAEWERGVYHFEYYDWLYQEDIARGIKPVFMLLFAPYWATDSTVTCDQWTQDCRYPPASSMMGPWRAFAAAVAKRYPLAAAIEPWNEPNLHWSWEPKPDVSRYVELQKNAYQAIKGVSPTMKVLSAGFGNQQTSDATSTSLPEYLRAFRLAGGLNYVDALAVHPYAWSLDNTLLRTSVQQVRDAATAGGRSGLPIWVTEIGLSTTGYDYRYVFTDAQQATGLVSEYNTLAAMPDVKAIFVHTLIEPLTYGAQWQWWNDQLGYGVLHPDLTPKPAYCALANLRGSVGAGCAK